MPYDDGNDVLECLQVTGDGRQIFDLRTGDLLSSEVKKVGGLLPRDLEVIPYPGDISDENTSWIVDCAINLDKMYPAEYVFLDFAGTLLIANHERDPDRTKFHRQMNDVFEQINRFRDYYQKTRGEALKVLVLSTGETVPFEGYVDIVEATTRFKNFAFTPFETYMGVFFDAKFKNSLVPGDTPALKEGSRSPKPLADFSKEESEALEFISEMEGIEMVFATADWLEEIGDYSLEYATGSPDLLIRAAKGRHFLMANQSSRKFYYVTDMSAKTVGYGIYGDWDDSVPLNSITDVFSAVKHNLSQGPTMVAVIEGAAPSDIQNYRGEIDVTVNGITTYLYHFLVNVNTGIPLTHTLVPYGTNIDFIKTNKYPYSWGITPVTGGLGSNIFNGTKPKKSIAVGTRSIFMHTATNCDVSLEPWVRNRTENGSLFVVNRDQISRKRTVMNQ